MNAEFTNPLERAHMQRVIGLHQVKKNTNTLVQPLFTKFLKHLD